MAVFALAQPSVAADTLYKYDSLGRLVEVTYASGQKVRYVYDAAGNRRLVAANSSFSNTAPDAVNETINAVSNLPFTFHPLRNDSDPDGDGLTITTNSSPTHGTVTKDGARLTYTATWPYSGSDSFTYTISDGTTTDTATVNVTVTMPTPILLSGGAGFSASGYQCHSGGGDYWDAPSYGGPGGYNTLYEFCFSVYDGGDASWFDEADEISDLGPFLWCPEPVVVMDYWYCGDVAEDYVPHAYAFWTQYQTAPWVKADLGETRRLERVEVAASNGVVEYSVNGSSWTAGSLLSIADGWATWDMGKVNARYVRILDSNSELFVTGFKVFGWVNP